jgi:hypothetical protein
VARLDDLRHGQQRGGLLVRCRPRGRPR